ncbi:hypothetical protein [Burkholderia mayonis]|uniref:Uncharacterized protein n=1 Tax=Burkholderia mayonis TaxID=1385591 RepID=A0A1B4G0J2_9BURK|nr:hypothetical protein [Burkholderia mayonis]AOJ09429.1 hypothetical protein WS71_18975 [Burkholderia mayonis]KVE47244.1 hypothetical protein WS71_19920 [Burkholderia mayonis]
MPNAPVSWEPYCHRSEAEFHLSNFASKVLGQKAGVVFFDGVGASRLKFATPDANGNALDLVIAVSRPPLMPADPLSSATPQTIDQLSRQWAQSVSVARRAQSGPSLLGQRISRTRDVIEGHRMAFDSAAVGGDTFGVLAGVVSLAVILAGGVTLLPALGVAAGITSALLRLEDGRIVKYELTGDEVRKKQLGNTWHDKIIETVGPILILPNLIASGPRALASLPGIAREAGEMSEEAVQATKQLSAQRNAIDAFKSASLDNPERALLQAPARQMEERASRFADAVREAQKKLMQARRELLLLRTIEAPAYMASLYGAGVYGIDPPDAVVARGVDWMQQHLGNGARQDLDHPARLLAPDRPMTPPQPGTPSPILQLHVGVSHRPGATH